MAQAAAIIALSERLRKQSRKARNRETIADLRLATCYFVSPRIIAAIVDGTAPANLTVTGLAKALPYSCAEQEQSIGLLQ